MQQVFKNMSRIKTKEELLERISQLQTEIQKLVNEYVEYAMAKKNRKKKKKSIAQMQREKDTQCLAQLKNGSRCSKKRSTETDHDPELCKLHNKPKYDGTLVKVELPIMDDNNSVTASDDDSIGEESDEESTDEDLIQVKLTVDADGHTIDQEGNIWNMEKQIIIGKKDFRTKHKVFFKQT